MSFCLQASFVGCTYILKYVTEQLLGDIKNFLSNIFYHFFCLLQIIGKNFSFAILHMPVHPCSTVLCAQNWLHVADFCYYRGLRYMRIRELSVKFTRAFMVRWIFVYVLINMFNTTVCYNINFTLLQRKTIWSVISCIWRTGRGCDIHAYAEIVLVILL
jgi:hypothetical protein